MSDWGRVKEIFAGVRDLPETQRPAALAERCAGDPALRAAVLELLAADAEAEGFLRTPADAPTPSASDAEQMLGTAVGPYVPVEVLGEGGFGIVYRARQEAPVRREVALKVLKPGMDSRMVLARFELERRALGLMEHPNIARALDAGATPAGRPYFVMELVAGLPLTRYCDANRLSLRARVELLLPICRAVQHAHQKGVIHRDLKPGNILVNSIDGRPLPKVIDFGIAKALDTADGSRLTQTRQPVGTPAYMSPEQARADGAAIDTRTDVYALGVILHEVLVGVLPRRAGETPEHDPERPSTRLRAVLAAGDGAADRASAEPRGAGAETIAELADRRQTTPSGLRAGLRGDLDWIILRCLAPEPEQRYDSVAELARDLEMHLAGQPILAGPRHWSHRLARFVRRNRAALLAAGTALTALVVGLVLAVGGWIAALDARSAERLAREDAQRAADRAAAVNRFLGDLLSAADPRLSGRELTVRNMLLEGASRMDAGALADQPEIEADVRVQIGRSLRELGQLAAAEPQLARAHDLRNDLYGPDSPETIDALVELATLQSFDGRLEPAEANFRRALAFHEARPTRDDRALSRICNDLGTVLSSAGRFDEAEAMLRRALELAPAESARTTSTGLLGLAQQRESARADALNNLGLVRARLGAYDEAESLISEALELNRATLGPTHPYVATNLDNLAQTLVAQQRLPEAEERYREALAIRRARLDRDHPDLAISLHNLGTLVAARAEWLEAEALVRESFKIFLETRGWESLETLTTMNSLVSCLGAQSRLRDAEALMLAAFDGIRDGPMAGPRLSLAERLAQLYDALQSPDEAACWRAEAERAAPRP